MRRSPHKESSVEKKKIFSPALLMLIFTVAGVIGFIYEEICVYINDGVFAKRGTTFGPWIPIYGFGALLIFFLTISFRRKPWLVFIISSVSCGLLELITGFVLDKFFHLRLWDYSLVMLNWGNLQLVCRDCHAELHSGRGDRRYTIDEFGRVDVIGPPIAKGS